MAARAVSCHRQTGKNLRRVKPISGMNLGFRADPVHGKTWGRRVRHLWSYGLASGTISAALGGERPWRILVLYFPWGLKAQSSSPVPHPTTGGIRL